MSDVTVFNISVPAQLFSDVEKICAAYGSDFRSEIIHLLECYVDSYKRLTLDPVVKEVIL